MSRESSRTTSPVEQGEYVLPAPLSLQRGGVIPEVRVAWRLEGAPDKPVVLVLGGISATRHVVGNASPEQSQGWWASVMGPNRALDTHQYRVLGMDYLGGSGLTTGPAVGEQDFPIISAADQVMVIQHLLAHLQLKHVHAVIGASYGGMVALMIGALQPHLAQRLIVISAAHCTHPMATAWRSVQRAMVRYAISHDEGREGLRLARALAMATYRSPQEFAQRFADEPQLVNGRPVFAVERYLFARGQAYKDSYVPESFLCLSESIDLHRVDPTAIRVPTTLIAVLEDQLVPVADMRQLYDGLGGQKHWVELSSLYGHDAFLKETEALRAVFAAAL